MPPCGDVRVEGLLGFTAGLLFFRHQRRRIRLPAI
jgi:hypothetical protein